MKVFVSHSMKDQIFLESIHNSLVQNGIQLLIAEHEISLTHSISDKIKGMIDECQMGLVLLTKNGLTSGFVREEIGYLEAKEKKTIIILEQNLRDKYSGFKFGYDYIELDPNEPEVAIEKAKETFSKYWRDLCENSRRIELQKSEMESKRALVVLGILASLLIIEFLSE
jgi:hypothetical protein